MLPGVRPIIFFASAPTARMPPVLVLIATTDGSLSTIPRPLTYTSVLAVPRSTAMSRPRKASALLICFPLVQRVLVPRDPREPGQDMGLPLTAYCPYLVSAALAFRGVRPEGLEVRGTRKTPRNE